MGMVEKVARAIKRQQIGNHAELSKDGPWREFEMDAARAAIEAMREPTEAMIEDGVLAYNLTGIAGGIINTAEDHVAFIFSAMLPGTPAALNTKGGE